jgi:hypothetical protein
MGTTSAGLRFVFASRGVKEARSIPAMILRPRPRQLSLLLLLVGCSCEEPIPPTRRCDLGSSELDATTDATVRQSLVTNHCSAGAAGAGSIRDCKATGS